MKNKFMKRAIELAEIANNNGDVPVGAVIVFNNEIIGEGYNKKELTNDPTAHAEIIAIKEACENKNDWRLIDCEMYATMEPCLMCSGAAMQARIKKIYYELNNDKFGFASKISGVIRNKEYNHSIEVIQTNISEKNINMLKKFFKAKRQ